MQNLIVRRAGDTDVLAARRLHDDSGNDLTADPVLEHGQLGDDPGIRLYLAEVDSEPIGYLIGTLAGDWSEHLLMDGHPMPQPFLYAVAVLPRYMRQGVATRLLTAFLDDARSAGRTAIASLPYDGNDSAAAWHYALGFRLAEDPHQAQAVHASIDEIRVRRAVA